MRQIEATRRAAVWVALAALGLLALVPVDSPTSSVFAASPAPQLEVLDVTVGSLAVSPGEPVLVETNVHNPSDQEHRFIVVLLVDEVPEEERSLVLPPRATQTLRFTVIRSEPGAHVVRVGPHAATFQVLSAQFRIRELLVSPPVVTPGEPVSLRATVENVGAAPGIFQVPLAVNGIVVDLRTDLLAVGERKVVAFQTIPQASGSYTVLVGDVPGAFTVVSPAIDVTIPSSMRISLPTASAASGGGGSLEITRDVVSLSMASSLLAVTLPVGLAPGQTLGSFHDSVSGIEYDDTELVIPIRDALYREVARLVATPVNVVGLGDSARVVAGDPRLIVADTPFQLPPSATPAAPVSFGMVVALAGLELDKPLRLTQGVRPAPEILAQAELAARERNMTVVEVVASVTVETPVTAVAGQRPIVAFGMPSTWLESVVAGEPGVVHIQDSGQIEVHLMSQTAVDGERTVLKAKVSSAQGTFALALLSEANQPEISDVVVSPPAATVGVAVEVRALVEDASDQGDAPSSAVLRLDGKPVAVEPVRVLEDGSRAAIFYVSAGAPGEYSLDIEGAAARFHVGLRDVFGHAQVLQLSVSPQEVSPGQPIDVAATIGNVGSRSLVAEVILEVNGLPVERRLLPIAPGNTEDVSFSLARNKVGAYQVALLSVRGEFAVTREPTPAAFQVTNLRVEPPTVDPGQPVTVTFVLRNGGEEAGSYLARVLLNGREVEEREVLVGGLTTLPVTFPIQPVGDGIFTVEVEEMRRDFVVVPSTQRSNLVLETVTVEPPTVAGGEAVTITVNLRNRASEPSTGVLSVLVNGVVVDQREVELEAAGNTQETFVVSRETPGMYEVEVRQGVSADVVTGLLKGQFLVIRSLTPASWEISQLEVLPQPAEAQEPLTARFMVSNLGQQAGELLVTVAVDGAAEWEETLSIGPQTTEQFVVPLKGRARGTYMLSVNETEVRFTVASAPQETAVPTATPGPEEDDGTGGGRSVWIAALLVAVLASAGVGTYVLLNRRGSTQVRG